MDINLDTLLNYLPLIIFFILIIFLIKWMKLLQRKQLENTYQFCLKNGYDFLDTDYVRYRIQDKKYSSAKNFNSEIFNQYGFIQIHKSNSIIERVFKYKFSESNILSGNYKYTTSNGKSSSTTHINFSIFDFGNKIIPNFRLKNENFLTRFTDKFSKNDINFENNKIFSDKFNLVPVDKKDSMLVKDYFNKNDLLNKLSQLKIIYNLQIVSNNNKILFYVYGDMTSEKELNRFVNKSKQIFELFNNK